MRSRRRARSRLWVAISAARPVWRTRSSSVFEHALAGRVVEVAGRLVAEQDLGVVGERAGDRDALLLAAREPRRPVSGARREADLLEKRRRLFPRLPARRRGDHLRQHDVFERREFRQQVVKLVDEADFGAAQQRSAVHRRGGRNPLRRSAPPRRRGAPSRPATCSRVDFPAPDGPTSATISPGSQREIDPIQHASSVPACLKTRRTPRSSSAAPSAIRRSFVAQGLDRVEPRRAPGRIERSEERQSERHRHDRGDFTSGRSAPGSG